LDVFLIIIHVGRLRRRIMRVRIVWGSRVTLRDSHYDNGAGWGRRAGKAGRPIGRSPIGRSPITGIVDVTLRNTHYHLRLCIGSPRPLTLVELDIH